MDPNVLIVEDHKDLAYVMAKLLRKMGFAVTVANCCSDARKVAAVEKPGMVLCEMALPDGDSCDLLRELNQEYGAMGIVLSDSSMPDEQQRFMEAGFRDFLIKPYTFKQITELAERVMTETAYLHSLSSNSDLGIDPPPAEASA